MTPKLDELIAAERQKTRDLRDLQAARAADPVREHRARIEARQTLIAEGVETSDENVQSLADEILARRRAHDDEALEGAYLDGSRATAELDVLRRRVGRLDDVGPALLAEQVARETADTTLEQSLGEASTRVADVEQEVADLRAKAGFTAEPEPTWKRWLPFLGLALLSGLVGAFLMTWLYRPAVTPWPGFEERLAEVEKRLGVVTSRTDALKKQVGKLVPEVKELRERLENHVGHGTPPDPGLVAEVKELRARLENHVGHGTPPDPGLVAEVKELRARLENHVGHGTPPDPGLVVHDSSGSPPDDSLKTLLDKLETDVEKLEKRIDALPVHTHEGGTVLDPLGASGVAFTPAVPHGKRPWKDADVKLKVEVDQYGRAVAAEIADGDRLGREGTVLEANQFLAKAVALGSRFEPASAFRPIGREVNVTVHLFSHQNPLITIESAD